MGFYLFGEFIFTLSESSISFFYLDVYMF